MTPVKAMATVPARGQKIDRSGCPARRHGTASAKHNHGCVCPDAADLAYRARKIQRIGRSPHAFTPTTGLIRRVHALQALGWSYAALGEELGTVGREVWRWTTMIQVRVVTHQRVLVVYDRLRCQSPPDGRAATRTRIEATRRGWATPQQWDGVAIDDPAATSDLAHQRSPVASTTPMAEDVAWLDAAWPITETDPAARRTALAVRDERIARHLGCTPEEVRQSRGAARNGRAHGAKLTDDAIREIRRRYLDEVVTGRLPIGDLADAHSIGRSQLVNVLAGRTRQDLDLPDIRVDLRKERKARTTSPIPTKDSDAALPGRRRVTSTEVAA